MRTIGPMALALAVAGLTLSLEAAEPQPAAPGDPASTEHKHAGGSGPAPEPSPSTEQGGSMRDRMRGMHDTPPAENDEAAGGAPEQKRCGPEDMECRIGELERQQRRSDERMKRMERAK